MNLKHFVVMIFSLTTVATGSNLYSGKYSYDLNPDKPEGRYGHVIIEYLESDTYTFKMDLGRGAPSYNTGELEGNISISNGQGTYYKKSEYSDSDACEWKMTFSGEKLIIKTLNSHLECGFGYAVYVDGEYHKQ